MPDRLAASGISDAAIRAELDRILAEPAFRASDRNRRFLRFVVEEVLGGRASRIKSYAIAVDVFGRGQDFDASVDPIVRIEATRLRAALDAYNAGPGQESSVRITLPKGGYVPAFQLLGDGGAGRASPPEPPSPPPAAPATDGEAAPQATPHRWPGLATRRWVALGLALVGSIAAIAIAWTYRGSPASGPTMSRGPGILVDRIVPLGDELAIQQMAQGLAQSLVMAMTRFAGIRVAYGPGSGDKGPMLERLLREAKPADSIYVVESSLRKDANTLRLWWRIADARTGDTLWSETADRAWDSETMLPIEDDIARQIARHIGEPTGLVVARETAIQRVRPTFGYGCVLRARAYYFAIAEPLHREMRDCLEKTVAADPDYADAWAVLGFVYLDEDRYEFNRRGTAQEAADRALAAAKRAATLAPSSELAQEALLVVHYRRGEFAESEQAGRRALEINPNNPELLSEVGTRLYGRGKWDEGIALVRKAAAQSLVVPPLVRIVLVFDHYRKAEYEKALEELNLANLPGYYWRYALLAAVLAQLGRVEEAQPAVNELLRLRPNFAATMRGDLRSRHYAEPLIDELAAGLRRAGVDVR